MLIHNIKMKQFWVKLFDTRFDLVNIFSDEKRRSHKQLYDLGSLENINVLT